MVSVLDGTVGPKLSPINSVMSVPMMSADDCVLHVIQSFALPLMGIKVTLGRPLMLIFSLSYKNLVLEFTDVPSFPGVYLGNDVSGQHVFQSHFSDVKGKLGLEFEVAVKQRIHG